MQCLKGFPVKGRRKNVCNFFIGAYKIHGDNFLFNIISKKVMSNLYMLSPIIFDAHETKQGLRNCPVPNVLFLSIIYCA